ncbi:MAG TPA: hydroxymethylbilane synthase [Pyrinomonadaceae bacterium]|nr:hydroxymethylbilane synthase [Pyrinomonadaceae bacterium]
MNSRIVIGSRGSRLALVQAEWVKARLSLLEPEIEVQIEIIKTTGDVKSDPLSVIGGKGVFTKELENALMERRIDVAVHSLKDLPTIVPEPLKLAAICEREDPRDALVLPLERHAGVSSLNDLNTGAVVGTSSPRRLAQLANIRPDLECADLRGNVDTRLRKLDEGQYHALILAAAGLRRLGFENRISVAISPEQMLPAVGQGALGIQTRVADAELNRLLTGLGHEHTRLACTAERSLLRTLGGGCLLPIAGHAVISNSTLILNGLVASRNGKQILRDRVTGDSQDAERLGADLAARLLANGAGDLL